MLSTGLLKPGGGVGTKSFFLLTTFTRVLEPLLRLTILENI